VATLATARSPTGERGGEMVDPSVSASADYVSKLGQRFIDWGVDVDNAGVELDLANITPGSLPSAAVLKKDFTDRLNVWKDHNSTLRLALNGIGNGLIKYSLKYQSTEDINNAEAESIRDIIDPLATYYPSAEKILPPAAGSGYYPPPTNPPQKGPPS
jgi:hypothetical protein